MSIILGIALLAVAFYTGRHVTRNMASNGSAGRLSATRAGQTIRQGIQRGSNGADAVWATARSEYWLQRRKARLDRKAGKPTAGERIGSAARAMGASYRRRVTGRANRPKPQRSWLSRFVTPRMPGDDELSRRREARAARQEPPDDPMTGWPPERATGGQRQAPASGNSGARTGTIIPPPHPQPVPPQPTRAPAPQSASQTPPAAPAAANGRTPPVATGNGSAEDLIEAINKIHAEAAAGNINAKHAAIKAVTAGQERFSAMLAMLSRQLSEPGMHYGPEITEPLAKAASHQQAGSMASSESDSALDTLKQMQLGELPGSGRQAPHHTELQESGSR